MRRAKNTNKMRHFSSLLNEHWKRKQRLKGRRECQKASWRVDQHQDVTRIPEEREKTTMIDILGSMVSKSTERLITCCSSSLLLDSTMVDADYKIDCNAKYSKPRFAKNLRQVPITFTSVIMLLLALYTATSSAHGQALIQADPRPTIYSGQVSFGLLLSAHSSLGAELSTSASHQVNSMFAFEEPDSTSANFTMLIPQPIKIAEGLYDDPMTTTTLSTSSQSNQTISLTPPTDPQLLSESAIVEEIEGEESRGHKAVAGKQKHSHGKRQIFERPSQHKRRQQQQQLQAHGRAQSAQSSVASIDTGICNQVNANALYAGMGAIWASHQANLVGDSHLAIGTYVYDSCNDLDVGQRQSVRIVSNLNAFQQTTCESPRGSPISLTIAHGDNQLRAIQLLTSFRVPVITTKEHFALEDYNQLSRDQKRFLFSTAPSSRHLAVGALRFSKRIVSRSTSSPKLPNQFYKMSSKNGLIVISRNLPARFITYLTEMIPNHVNYEMLQSNQPIDQIRSVEALESILIKPSSSSSSSSLSSSETKLSSRLVNPPLPPATAGSSDHADSRKRRRRRRRHTTSDDSADSSGDESDSSSGESENTKMLSPTILMFITPSEAIDLVTRLRNDLAEVSKYYSLIVSTREDISPALKTIFHRGGSRLCSGKAFYTISPKPDDIGEFSRYFRDTVQMEGETSDHPLICEFAKYQSSTKVNADLDDISTEPVIKAVWSAAAAFKSVHRRECASLVNSSPATNVYRNNQSGAGNNGGPSSSASDSSEAPNLGRVMHSRQSNKSAHAECMVKMNKNMSNLVQRALKRLDVTINSTGLQSLDGFRLKFDDMNELMTNRFSIKYINKECEITEIGQFSGFKDSSLRIDEETLVKSLEATLPDAWPVKIVTPPPEVVTPAPGARPTAASSESTNKDSSASSTDSADASTTGESFNGDSGGSPSSNSRSRRKHKGGEQEKQGEDDDSTGGAGGGESDKHSGSESRVNESPKRPNKRSRAGNDRLSKRRSESNKSKYQLAAPVTAMGGRGILPGVTDTDTVSGYSTTPASVRPTTRTTTITEATTTKSVQRRLKPFPASIGGSTLTDWLPGGFTATTQASTKPSTETQPTRAPSSSLSVGPTVVGSQHDDEQVDSGESSSLSSADLKMRGTTQAPIFSTPPESAGNADLELPSKPLGEPKSSGKPMETAATTETSDYITSPSISKSSINLYPQQPHIHHMYSPPTGRQAGFSLPGGPQTTDTPDPTANQSSTMPDASIGMDSNARISYLRDLNSSPMPLPPATIRPLQVAKNLPLASAAEQQQQQQQSSDPNQSGRSRFRSHLKWIYSSWFALSILGSNICGALLTLYVLTFLLTKNCDGSLDRENQGIRSMHLLSIIVVFFGSTLFIVYPTPGMCLLRTSWHNFALVMLFGSLLLQTMQTRSLSSLGLGGRPNRLNQFLTLVFMVGVQVSFELQRWKYESANYLNFINQFFGSSASGDDKKLMLLSSAITNQFNPLNSFNDQVTPVSIQISEQYQSLLQDYCIQQADDFIQSQIYLGFIVGLLVIFSASTRKVAQRLATSPPSKVHHKLTSALTTTSGKLVASQHEANLSLTPSQFQFTPNASTSGNTYDTSNVFVVTLITVPIYSISVVLHVYDTSTTNMDLVSSVTMVLIAFVTLIGIFFPILMQIHRYDGLLANRLTRSLSSPVIANQTNRVIGDNSSLTMGSLSNAFAMFPEFAPTGLRRPSSTSGDSSSGAGSRRPFAESKESRRNMTAALANLGPSDDSLRSMGFYSSSNQGKNQSADQLNPIDPSLLNLKLNLSAQDQMLAHVDSSGRSSCGDSHHHQHGQKQPTARRISKGEKRLIMLDVDPCCPRHGIAATWAKTPNEPSTSKINNNNNSRTSQVHQ